MFRKDSLKLKHLSILFFFTVFLLGILLFKDYGVSLDERFHRNNALFWHDYVKSFISDTNSSAVNESINLLKERIKTKGNFVSGVPSIQPVPLAILYEFFVEAANLKNSKNIYQYRHLYNFIIYFLGLFFFYRLIYNRYGSYFYSLLGCLFLFLTPRFFSESFYNPQDIFFLSLTIINMYTGINFLRKPNFKNTFSFSLSSALSIDTRIMGFVSVFVILLFFVLKLLRSKKFSQNNSKFIFYSIPLTFLLIVIFWPFLWGSPFKNFVFALSELSSVKFFVTNLYFGQYISSIAVPWHYHIVWIGITSPIIIILLFLIGLFFLLRRIVFRIMKLNEDFNDIWRGDKEMSDIYFLIIIILSIYLFINQSLGYSGWRHLYFIYPSIIMIALSGFYNLHFFVKIKLFRFLFYTLVIMNLSYLAYWNYKFHPYQYVYFNLMFKNNFNNNFDKDYWGLSNKNSLEYIIKNSTNFPVKIATKSFASLEKSSLILNEKDKRKIEIIYNLDNADYVITNYIKRLRNEFIIDMNKYKKYHEILVDGKPINTVYKKIK